MRNSKKLLLLTLIAALTLSFAFATTASAKKIKQIDNFVMFLDQSGSMAQKYNGEGAKKIDMAIETMQAMNKAIPSLDYTSAMFMFAQFKAGSQPGTYKQASLEEAIGMVETDFDIYGGLSGTTGLIIFTDGKSNLGADPIAQAKALYAKYGDKLCIHVVSFADSAKGQMIIDEIRALSSCSVPADYASLMAPGGMDKYAEEVFYDEAAPAPAPAPAPVPMAKETITFNLNFGFDKYMIIDEMIPVLEQAKMILEENPSASFMVAGHTDSTGPEAYNQGLSERRAASVKNWLVSNGVPASRLAAKGYGEMDAKYDNATKEGRALNRRVEILTK